MKIKPILILILVLVGAITAWLIFNSMYNKPHRKLASEEPVTSVEASTLFTAYSTDEGKADSLYLNKVLQVEGTVEKIMQNEQAGTTLVLEGAELFGISCVMAESEKQKLETIKTGDKVKLKGLCNGMLMDVVLVKCVLTQ